MERLQKVIANAGYCSRRKAEELIQKGKVSVNGKIIREMGVQVTKDDQIMVEDHLLSSDIKVYYLLNKPRGVITSTKDDKHRQTVVDLLPSGIRIYPVGRLDYDTTGVLLLTNDGELSNLLMHPSSEVEKVYIAKIKGILTGEAIRSLTYGVMIDGVKTSRAKVKVRKVDKKNQTTMLELTIHEGKNHQVKKMIEAVGYEVDKLKRERVAFLTLDHLNSGEYRELNPKEVKKLYSLCSGASKKEEY